MLYPNKLVTTF